MEHLGHKTEEREHALINLIKQTKIQKAQERKILCLSSMILAGALGLCVLSPAVNAQQIYNTNSTSVAANTELRLQQMDDQMRQLTGRVEEQNYEIDQLKKQLIDLQNAQIKTQNNIQTGASQVAVPTRDPSVSINAPLVPVNPPKLSGMQTAKPVPTQANGVSMDNSIAVYDQAFASLKAKDFAEAEKEFGAFLKTHADHELAANAHYWLGETFYVRGQYKQAAKSFAEGFQKFPTSPKSPDILLKLGMSLAGMDNNENACVALSQLSVKFPTADPDLLARGASEMSRLGCDA